MDLDPLLLARIQFGATTIYHFLFVPLTIGLSGLVAVMQTLWVRTGDDTYLRMTKFWGKLFLVNFAMGVVTGIVQEFQFGMNWSDYSRFVGDVFGAPLAMEGMLAFFLEATFLGVWIFGWDRLPRLVHLASIWMVAIGTSLSAYFILAANAWMQNPVGFTVNEERGRAELTDIVAVLTNPVALVTWPHTIFACYLVAAALVMAVAAWHLARRNEVPLMRTSLRMAMVTALVGGLGLAVSGDLLARVMTEVQPMKMAAAEALYDTTEDASFSLVTVGTLDGSEELWSVRVPHLLSFMATGTLGGEVEGINDLQALYEEQYGPGDYAPIVPVTYWSFRLMIGLGLVTVGLAAVGLWLTRRGRLPSRPWVWRVAVWAFPLPLLGSIIGWVFTEMGRQPWIVFGLQLTEDGVSPGVPGWMVLTSLAAFTAVYAALAVVEAVLLVRYAKAGPPQLDRTGTDGSDDTDDDGTADRPRALAFAY
ncbi:cytochrome ubiquinol oxidase subunit I [Aquipuribacter nitratireducens]|uniref:Cytochrome ubiquinol oxidase subunit I n=1 Tax=Aquipuribacter nitratireducens TaxID=650104 RepID=A0ABW0GRY5_9MICO